MNLDIEILKPHDDFVEIKIGNEIIHTKDVDDALHDMIFLIRNIVADKPYAILFNEIEIRYKSNIHRELVVTNFKEKRIYGWILDENELAELAAQIAQAIIDSLTKHPTRWVASRAFVEDHSEEEFQRAYRDHIKIIEDLNKYINVDKTEKNQNNKITLIELFEKFEENGAATIIATKQGEIPVCLCKKKFINDKFCAVYDDILLTAVYYDEACPVVYVNTVNEQEFNRLKEIMYVIEFLVNGIMD